MQQTLLNSSPQARPVCTSCRPPASKPVGISSPPHVRRQICPCRAVMTSAPHPRRRSAWPRPACAPCRAVRTVSRSRVPCGRGGWSGGSGGGRKEMSSSASSGRARRASSVAQGRVPLAAVLCCCTPPRILEQPFEERTPNRHNHELELKITCLQRNTSTGDSRRPANYAR
jgi:hypothetical protein